MKPTRSLAASAGLVVLATLCALQGWSLWRAPAAWFPASVAVRLPPGETVVLGQRELAAPQADKSHLSLWRDARQGWMLRNLSASKQVVVQRDGGEQRMGSVALAPNSRFRIDAASFEVLSNDGKRIALSGDGHQWRYDGAVLYRDGQMQARCPDSHVASGALSVWNRLMPQVLTASRPLTFGGNLYCDNRLGLAGVTPGSALLARGDGELRLLAGSPDGERAALRFQDGGADSDLRRQEQPLAGVKAIVVGHTRFQLDIAGDTLRLKPSRHVALFDAPEHTLPAAVTWQWQRRALWQPSGGATAIWGGIAAALAAMLCAAAARRRTAIWAPRITLSATLAATLCLLLTGLAALVLQRAGQAPSAAQSMSLAACALLLWLSMPGRASLLAVSGLVLLAAGLLAQLELGLGGQDAAWLRYYQKSAAMLAIGVGLGGVLRLWSRQLLAPIQQRAIEWMLALFAAVALAALAAQVLWGDETGVFDLQPVELAKLALTALTAHCLALRFGWHAGPQRLRRQGARWLQLIAPALLFLALLGLALVQVDDFSPLILLLVWSTAMAFAYALAARNRALAAALVGMAIVAVGAVAYLRCANAEQDPLLPQAGGFYADRFQVWLKPSEHPHTGQQLLLGARAISEGGWLGADHSLGLRSLGQAAGGAMRIPAVQDDFAASFFLNRHGLAGGLLLWMAQAAFLAAMAQVALRAYAASARARDFRLAWAGRFRYFALCGGGAFVLGHFLLSWGTNLAIFPIMGQPMSFLSAGGSHLLFFLCPLLAFCAISAQSLEENESCPPMSNTKC